MILTNATMDYGEGVIALDKCYLMSGRDMTITDYLLVYRANGKYACLAVDEDDIADGRIDLPCPDGPDYHLEFGEMIDDDHEHDVIECTMTGAFFDCIAHGVSKPWMVQSHMMDSICRMGYHGY